MAKNKKKKLRVIEGKRLSSDGSEITHLKLKDNVRVTPIKNIRNMIKRHEIADLYLYGDDFVRSAPNGKFCDNLRNLPDF